MSTSVSPIRWYCKKLARTTVAASGRLGRVLRSRNSNPGGPCLRALTYHRFGDVHHDPFCITESVFRAQMQHVAENELALSLTQALAFLRGETELRQDSVLITIDDGFLSTYTIALPILKDLAVPAVAFVTPSLVDDHSKPSNFEHERYLNWQEIIELSGNGMNIGSHSWTHRSMGRMAAAQVQEEAVRSKALLERKLGVPVTAFAYPFGTRADFNDETARILKNSGYTSVFTSQHGAIRTDTDCLSMPRIKVESGEGLWLFRALTQGGMDGWARIDNTLWRLQASK